MSGQIEPQAPQESCMTIFGDPTLPSPLTGKLHAKNQTLTGIDDQNNSLIGDVDTMTDQAKGGTDHLTGGNLTSFVSSFFDFIENQLVGDAITMSGSAHGGNDTLIGGNNFGAAPENVGNELFGDAITMSGSAQGGNDT